MRLEQVDITRPGWAAYAALTDTTLTTVLAAPGAGRWVIVNWIWIYIIGGTATGLKIYSGATLKGVAPTGTVGSVPPLPIPLRLAANEALKIQLLDAMAAHVTIGYTIGPTFSEA
jgi:hypothetical protein